jgi:hypothetical protein
MRNRRKDIAENYSVKANQPSASDSCWLAVDKNEQNRLGTENSSNRGQYQPPLAAANRPYHAASQCRDLQEWHENAERLLRRDSKSCGADNDASYAPPANVSANVCKRLFHTSLVNSLRLHWHCYILHNLTHHLIGLL